MTRLAKNLILATAAVSAIFFVDPASVEAINFQRESICVKKICPFDTDNRQYLDFWSKFRDTVMPDPDEPQNNNPPKEVQPPPRPARTPKPVRNPKPAPPPREVKPKPAD